MPPFDLDSQNYLRPNHLLFFINCETINDTLEILDIWTYVNVNSMDVYRYLNYDGYYAAYFYLENFEI